MAVDNIYYKVKLYLEANSKTETEFDNNILLRPRLQYVGELDRKFTPISDR